METFEVLKFSNCFKGAAFPLHADGLWGFIDSGY